MDRLVAALGGPDRPRAAGVVWIGAAGRCCGPCGWCARSGGSAAGRGRRSRARRTAGAPHGPPRSPPQERGNSSYQAPKRARTRSTSIASGRSSVVAAGAIRVALDRGEQLRPSAVSCLASPRGRSCPRAPRARARSRARRCSARAPGGLAQQQHPLGQLAREVVLAGRELALELVAPGGERVGSTPRPSIASAPAVSTVKPPAQRTPSRWASIGCIGASRQRALARRRGSARPLAATSWPSRKTSAETVDESPIAALGRVAAAVDARRRVARSRSATAGAWAVHGRDGETMRFSAFEATLQSCNDIPPHPVVNTVNASNSTNFQPRSSGVQLHVSSLPGRAPRAAGLSRSSTGSPRPVSPGGRCSRSARRTAAARRTGALGVRRLERPARRRRRAPSRPTRSRRFASARRSGSATGSGSPVLGAVAGPGALRARVGRAACLRRRAAASG